MSFRTRNKSLPIFEPVSVPRAFQRFSDRRFHEDSSPPQAAHNRATTFRYDPADGLDCSAHAVGRPSGLHDSAYVAGAADVIVGSARSCQELTQASASKPELISTDYFVNCMIAHGAKPDG
jgi:hypothetical protein